MKTDVTQQDASLAGSSSEDNARTPLLRIDGLRKSFGGIEAIRGLDLTVHAEQILAIIGPNGSGKTTAFNLITGLLKPDAGRILWRPTGENITGKAPWEIFDLGIARTFQNIRLSLGLSVLENVLIGLYRETKTAWSGIIVGVSGVRKKEEEAHVKALKALKFISADLLNVADKPVGELSYADRRRVEIARAIVSGPRLLLLDEPTAGMNSRETEEMVADIRKVHAMGVTVLLIEHKMKFVSHLAEWVVVLNFGTKIAEGKFDEIRTDEKVIEAYLGRRKIY